MNFTSVSVQPLVSHMPRWWQKSFANRAGRQKKSLHKRFGTVDSGPAQS